MSGEPRLVKPDLCEISGCWKRAAEGSLQCADHDAVSRWLDSAIRSRIKGKGRRIFIGSRPP